MRALPFAALLLVGCAPSLGMKSESALNALRIAVVDVRAAPSRVERALSAMEAAASTNNRVRLIRANDRGLTFQQMASADHVDVDSLTALVEADAYVALDVEDMQHTLRKVYGPNGEYGYQAEAEARLGVRVALPDGRIAVPRQLDGRAYGPHPFWGSQQQLRFNDLPEQALDDAVMRFIADFAPL